MPGRPLSSRCDVCWWCRVWRVEVVRTAAAADHELSPAAGGGRVQWGLVTTVIHYYLLRLNTTIIIIIITSDHSDSDK